MDYIKSFCDLEIHKLSRKAAIDIFLPAKKISDEEIYTL
jgi:hypothetical protein